MFDYATITATLGDAATIAASGPTKILFSDGETFPDCWTPLDALPEHFDEATYVGGTYGFAHAAPAAVVREAWLVGPDVAAVHVFDPPLKVGAHEASEGGEANFDDVILDPGALVFGLPG